MQSSSTPPPPLEEEACAVQPRLTALLRLAFTLIMGVRIRIAIAGQAVRLQHRPAAEVDPTGFACPYSLKGDWALKKVLKWIAIVLGGLIGLVLVAAVALSLVGGAQWNKKLPIRPEPIPIPTDKASLARGEHIVNILCTGCHGEDLTGAPVFDEPGIASVYASNITGLADTWSDEELVLAIHHGIGQGGRELAVMPSGAFTYFSAQDTGSIIAYLKTVPRSGDVQPRPSASFMGRILYAAGMFGQIFSAEMIDHDRPYTPMPAEIGANPEYGEYLAQLCHECHGPDLRGGQPPYPDFPPAPSLAVVKGWTEEGFMETLNTGVDPGGHAVNPEYMPFDELVKFNPEELRGLYLYLHSLP